MNASQEVAARESRGVQKGGSTASGPVERAREREMFIIPAVDIFEDPQQLTVRADIPGVSKDTLDVKIDGNTLTIEGNIAIEMPAGMSALYADLQGRKYRRLFSLSGELDTTQIAANLQDGLLTVTIPKRPEYRARKIPVEAR